MNKLSDVLLIIAWMAVIAFNLPYNKWLIVLSIIYWFFSGYDSYKEEKDV